MKKIKISKFGRLLAVEVLCILFFFIKIFMPKEEYHFYYNQNVDEISENRTSDGDLIIQADSCELDYGRYFITCNYSSKEDAAYYKVNSDKNVYTKEVGLYNDENSRTIELWVLNNNTSIQIELIAKENADFFLESFLIKETNYSCYLAIIIFMIILVLTVLIKNITYKKIVFSREKIFTIGAIAFIVIISSIPLFTDHIVIGHDTELQITRIEGIKEGLLAGQLPVRIDPVFNRGYGYAIPLFYGSLFVYIPAVMRLIGFTLQFSFKFYVVLINLMTAYSSYYCIKKITSDYRWGITGSFLFTLSAYRFTDLYTRGAIGQCTAWAFLPVIVVGLWNIYSQSENEEKRNLWILPVIGYTGVIQSHIISTEIYGIFTMLFCLLMWKRTFKKNVFFTLLKVVIITILVNISFILPLGMSMLREQIMVKESIGITGSMQQYGAALKELFGFFIPQFSLSDWRMREGFIGLGAAFGIGLAGIIYAAVSRDLRDLKNKKMFYSLTVIVILGVVISTNIFPWDAIISLFDNLGNRGLIHFAGSAIAGAVSNIQWPYRFLTITIFTYVILICVSFKKIKNTKVRNTLLICAASVTLLQFVLSSVGAVMTADKNDKIYSIYYQDEDYSNNLGMMEYYPALDDGLMAYTDMRDKLTYNATNCIVEKAVKNYTNIMLDVNQTNEGVGTIELPLFYYNGYVIENLTTGERTKAFVSGSRRVMVISLQGHNEYKIYYEGDKIWKVADIISIASILLLSVYAWWSSHMRMTKLTIKE